MRRTGVLTRLALVLALIASTLPAFAVGNLTLAWDAPAPAPDVAGYIVHYATTSGQYASATNVGNATAATISGLQDGVTYYFAVTAYNTAGLESDMSNEVAYSVPVATVNNPPTLNAISSLSIAEDAGSDKRLVVAYVIPQPGRAATPDELLAFGRKHLAAYKAPKVVYIAPDFPRTRNGKIVRREITPQIATARSAA